METPTIKRLRMEFMLVNCRKDSPTAAESQRKATQKPSAQAPLHQSTSGRKQDDQPTSPNRTQYTAAKMVNGMEANKAPNFPATDKIKMERSQEPASSLRTQQGHVLLTQHGEKDHEAS